MPKAHPMWRGFNSGEWSPLMDGAVDHKQYPFAVHLMENMIPLLQGPAQTRPGFRFIAEAKFHTLPARLSDFVYDRASSFILEWGQLYVRFFTAQGQVVIAGTTTPYEIVTPYDSGHVLGLQFAESNDVSYISHRLYWPQKLIRVANDDWTIADAPILDGPFRKENTDPTIHLRASAVTGSGVTLTATQSIASDIGTWGGVAGAAEPLFTAAAPYGGFQFTTTDACRLNKVYMYQATAPAVDVIATAYIYTDVAGSPGALVDTSDATVNLNANIGTLSWDFSGCSLLPATTYWLVTGSDITDAAITFSTVADNAAYESDTGAAIAGLAAGVMATDFRVKLNITTDSAASVFKAGHVGSLWRLRHTGVTVTQEHDSTGVFAGRAVIMYGAFDVDFTPVLPTGGGAYFQGFVTLQKSTNLADWTDVATFSQSTRQEFFETKTGTYYRTYSKPADIDSGAAWGRIIQNEKWGVVKVTAFTAVHEVTVTVISNLATTERTPYWREGSWSAYRGYPVAIGWYQDRLVFGGCAGQPKTVWMSWTGDYETFIPEGKTDDAAIDLTLQDLANPIQWVAVAGKVLAIGTQGEECALFARATKAFSATNLDTSIPEHVGSATNAGYVRAGPALIFIQSQRLSIHELVYSVDSDGLTAPDLTTLASHMGGVTGFRQLAYQHAPNRIIWGVRNDGVLAGLTYYRREDVLAWHRLTTDGLIRSVACKPSGAGTTAGRDETWALIQRTIDGQTKRYIELLEDNSAAIAARSVKDMFTVDSGLSYTGVPITTVTGLDHLEDKDVYGLADGFVVGPLRVFGGSVTLDTAASVIHLGLPYTCILQTMRVEAGAADGTAQGRTKQFSEVTFRLLCTLGGKFGPSADLLQRFNNWAPNDQIMGVQSTPFDGDLREMWPGGANTDGQIMVVQDQPLPLTLVAIMPEVSTE